jgi:hypothetical protein
MGDKTPKFGSWRRYNATTGPGNGGDDCRGKDKWAKLGDKFVAGVGKLFVGRQGGPSIHNTNHVKWLVHVSISISDKYYQDFERSLVPQLNTNVVEEMVIVI